MAGQCVRKNRTTGRASRHSGVLHELYKLGRPPKRKHEPQGEAQMAENNLALRLARRMKKQNPVKTLTSNTSYKHVPNHRATQIKQ